MDRLEVNILIEAYEKAVELRLEEDFISFLREEIDNRNKKEQTSSKQKIFA